MLSILGASSYSKSEEKKETKMTKKNPTKPPHTQNHGRFQRREKEAKEWI